MRPQARQIELQRVGQMNGHIGVRHEGVTQPGLEPRIDLDHMDVACVLRKALGEDSEAAPDLQHDVLVIECRKALDDVEQVAIDEEVLTQVAGSPRAHQPKTTAALRSTCPSSSS